MSGQEAAPRRVEYAYRLMISPSTQNPELFALRAQCLLDGAPLDPAFHLFRFFEDINKRLPGYLRAKKRKEVFCGVFFELLAVKTKSGAERIIKTALAEADINKSDMRREASRFLGFFHNEAGRELEQVLFHGGAWKAVPVRRQAQALLYRIPYELFGWEVFDGMERFHELSVNAGVLYDVLPLLHQKLSDQGIALFLNGKPVRTAQWEVEIDAVRSAGIDWFEVRPEIRCDGSTISMADLGARLTGKGFVEADECIQVLDSNTREVLKRIAGLAEAAADGTRAREIVPVPRLRILDWMSLASKGVKIRLGEEDRALMDRLLNFERIEPRPLPRRLRAKLRPYQRGGYHWLAFLYEHRFGACLADDMGLGKTLQAITFLAGIREGMVSAESDDAAKPHLIVVPPSLLFNWEHEIGKFYPGLKVNSYAGSGRTGDFTGSDIVLTTYGIVRQDIDTLKDVPFHVVIFDEAQTVKNIYAAMTGAARRLQARFKLTMTGTPLENHVGEYWSIIDLALPGLLGEYDEFRSRAKSSDSSGLDTIIRRTRPFVLRRTKDKVLRELPPKIETDVYLDLTEEQKALYTRTVQEVRNTIDTAYQEKTEAQAKIIALTAILKLRQICVSPRLAVRDRAARSPKLEFLVEQLQELRDEDHSALVFSQFTSFLDILEEGLREQGIDYLRLDGSTPVGKRKRLVRDFQEGTGPSVFLLSLKAGGQGLNLTRASYVFHLDPWWNPAVESQASDRAHRIGQKSKVTITRILMRHTIEEKMMELKSRKRALYDAVMQDADGGKAAPAITKSDFEFLLA